MRKPPHHHSVDDSGNESRRNSDKPFGLRLYSAIELKRIYDGISICLFGEERKLKSSRRLYVNFVKDINALKQNKKIEASISESFIEEFILFIHNINFKNLPESKLIVKTHSRNSKSILAIENYCSYCFAKQQSIKGVKYFSQKDKPTSSIIKGWKPDPTRSFHRQGVDYLILPLHGNRFKRLVCTVHSESSYYRFGIKFIGDEAFGKRRIETPDDSVLIHTGIGTMRQRHSDYLFTTFFDGDVRGLKNMARSRDQVTDIKPDYREGYAVEVIVDDDNFVSFKINNKLFEHAVVSRKAQSKVYLIAWADGLKYDLLVKDIKLETRKD